MTEGVKRPIGSGVTTDLTGLGAAAGLGAVVGDCPIDCSIGGAAVTTRGRTIFSASVGWV